MSDPQNNSDSSFAVLLARLKAMQERSRKMQEEIVELEDVVRRQMAGENPPPQPPDMGGQLRA